MKYSQPTLIPPGLPLDNIEISDDETLPRPPEKITVKCDICQKFVKGSLISKDFGVKSQHPLCHKNSNLRRKLKFFYSAYF